LSRKNKRNEIQQPDFLLPLLQREQQRNLKKLGRRERELDPIKSLRMILLLNDICHPSSITNLFVQFELLVAAA
jgi:hypothetical protein